MNVVWHHDRDMEIVFSSVVMGTARKDNIAVRIGQHSAILRHKCNEVRLVVTLQVRQIATIKAHDCKF